MSTGTTGTTHPRLDEQTAQPNQPDKAGRPPGGASGVGAALTDRRTDDRTSTGLTRGQCVWAAAILVFWLNLFAGGMLVDTEPYRCTLSWSAIDNAKIDPKVIADHPCQAYWGPETVKKTVGGKEIEEKVFNRFLFGEAGGRAWQPLLTWLVAIFFFTPLNLAFISVAAGMLGSLGSLANLNADPGEGAPSLPATDRTNPLLSGLLRGMFVYLFMISGMLLFDDSPFSATSADQYLRLAGFVSLFSFVVNYQPSVFGNLIAWANERINARGRSGRIGVAASGEVEMEAKAKFNVTAPDDESHDGAAEAGRPAAVRADKPTGNGNGSGPNAGG